MPHARLRTAAAFGLVAVVTLTSCTGEDTGSLEERIRDLDGVRDVSVDSVQVEEDQAENLVVVDAEAGVSADELTAVLEAVADDPPEDDDPGNHPFAGVIYVDSGTTEWASPADAPGAGLWFDAERLDDAPQRAALLVAATGLFPDDVVVVEPAAVRIELDTQDAEEVTAAAADLASDEVLGEAAGVEVAARHDGRPVATLSTSGSLDPGLVETWQELLATRDLAPGVTTTLVTLDLGDTGRIETSIQTPEGNASASDGRLRPMLRAQLVLLDDLPDGSVLEVTRESDLKELLEIRKGERLPRPSA